MYSCSEKSSNRILTQNTNVPHQGSGCVAPERDVSHGSEHSCCCKVFRAAISALDLANQHGAALQVLQSLGKHGNQTLPVEVTAKPEDLSQPERKDIHAEEAKTRQDQPSACIETAASATLVQPAEQPVKRRRNRRRKPPPPPEVAALKRRAYLDRNRQAATRCRTRRKEEVTDLGNKESELRHLNGVLKEVHKDLLQEAESLREKVRRMSSVEEQHLLGT